VQAADEVRTERVEVDDAPFGHRRLHPGGVDVTSGRKAAVGQQEGGERHHQKRK
jgi:hypothetical protein